MTLSTLFLLGALPALSAAVGYRVALWPRLVPKVGRPAKKIDRTSVFYVAALMLSMTVLHPWLAYDSAQLALLTGFIVVAGSLAGHDFKRGLIPYEELLLLTGLGATWALSQNTMVSAFIGVATGIALFAILNGIWRLTSRSKQAVGTGDVILVGALGAWTGIELLGTVLFVAAVTALAAAPWQGRDGKLRFGPYLVTAAFVVLLGVGFRNE